MQIMENYIQSQCSCCGQLSKIESYSSINTGKQPELKEKVLDGSLFIWKCPKCGTSNLIQSNILYHDPDNKLMIWITGGSPDLEQSVASTYGRIDEMKSYTARFVDDAGSLIEKVKIIDSGLDDVVMEICKYVTKTELGQKMSELGDVNLRYLNLNGPDNEMNFAYPLKGQMQIISVGFNVYEDCRGIVKRNPALVEASSGFTKIDAQWVARYLR